MKPPLSDLESDLFTIQLGRVISNAPKNEAAKTIKIRKKITFGSQCVASQLKISAVTDAPPAKYVIPMMIAIGMV
jgi:hypothetical protein